MKVSFRMRFLILALVFPMLLSISAPHAAAFGDSYLTVSAGSSVSYAIREDGSLWSWGNQVYGMLGDGVETYTAQPAPQKVLDGVVSVSVSDTHVLAVTYDGKLYGWGLAGWGQLGPDKDQYGSYISSSTPRLILTGVKAASAGNRFSMVVKTDGSLWTMGENITGELGIGKMDTDVHAEPVKIMENVVSVSASSVGYASAYAVQSDGTLWAWGDNSYGHLGDGTETSRYSPVKVLDNVASVSTGVQYFAMAVKKDGTLWGWGTNLYNVLTSGAAATQKTPYKIMSGVASVSVGEEHAMVLKTDGTLWALGCELNGRLGNGVMKNDSPSQAVKVADNVASVAAGRRHTLMVKKDGSLWACGQNDSGQLGNSNYSQDLSVFQKIGTGFKIPVGTAITATPNRSSVLVDGTVTAFDAYTINGYNYFKLRDLAYILNGTQKQFSVGWDGTNMAISIATSQPYTPVGGEMAVSGSTQAKAATPSASSVYIDGKQIQFSAYTIGGNNYFKLRDVAACIDFGVSWDSATSSIKIETTTGYNP